MLFISEAIETLNFFDHFAVQMENTHIINWRNKHIYAESGTLTESKLRKTQKADVLGRACS